MASPIEADGTLGRAIGFGLGAAAVGALVWYGLAIWTGREFGLVAIAVGLLVGYATAAGYGRGGTEVALVSLAIYGVGAIGGQYLIQNHFYQTMLEVDDAVEQIAMDGDYTEDEKALLLGYSSDEWNDLSAEERQEELDFFAEYEDEYFTEEAMTVPDDVADTMEALPSSLGFGDFFALLPFTMGFMGWIIFFIGAYEAWKIPASAG